MSRVPIYIPIPALSGPGTIFVLNRCLVRIETVLLRASTVGRGADAAARVAADESSGAQGLATLLALGSAKLFGAPMTRFNTDAAARVAALKPTLADRRAALSIGRRNDQDGRADLLSARHAGLDTHAAGRVAAGHALLAHGISTLGASDGDAVGLPVDDLAGGANGALDGGTRRDGVAGVEIDWVAADPGGNQEGEQQSSGREREAGHGDGMVCLCVFR
jgi:hypothetical protein